MRNEAGGSPVGLVAAAAAALLSGLQAAFYFFTGEYGQAVAFGGLLLVSGTMALGQRARRK